MCGHSLGYCSPLSRMYISYTGCVICDLLAAQIAAEGMFISMGGGIIGGVSEGWPVLPDRAFSSCPAFLPLFLLAIYVSSKGNGLDVVQPGGQKFNVARTMSIE